MGKDEAELLQSTHVLGGELNAMLHHNICPGILEKVGQEEEAELEAVHCSHKAGLQNRIRGDGRCPLSSEPVEVDVGFVEPHNPGCVFDGAPSRASGNGRDRLALLALDIFNLSLRCDGIPISIPILVFKQPTSHHFAANGDGGQRNRRGS